MTTGIQSNLNESGKKLWHGVKRDELTWYPKISSNSCSGCSICVLTCGNSVFKWNVGAHRPVVANPQNCVLGCTTCGKLCPENAISFPCDPKTFIRAATIKYKVFPAVKQELEGRLSKFPDHDVNEGSELKYGQ
ncbi:MAG: ferredoxin family protein [Candidatus Thermoplasmatota archaeon]|jgi:NAD-dependent dihydropyrimidine dehydrogenase PreA subunit|nr:ferredoxin family protein [Candidatus Thermoplasmatota archaeon]MCL5789116.1 ferredoxin family protein [Candidatus Thermoplasmatota archaeon]